MASNIRTKWQTLSSVLLSSQNQLHYIQNLMLEISIFCFKACTSCRNNNTSCAEDSFCRSLHTTIFNCKLGQVISFPAQQWVFFHCSLFLFTVLLQFSSLLLFSLAESVGSCPAIVMFSSNRDSRAVICRWRLANLKEKHQKFYIINAYTYI